MEQYNVAGVAVWWIASIIASISSKSVMEDYKETSGSIESWTSSLEDLRWIELSFLQHLLGGIASVFWLKVVLRRSIWKEDLSKTAICVAALTNLVGNVGTNAAYAAVSSCMTHTIGACEPVVTLVLSVFVYKKWERLTAKNVVSILFIVIGSGALVMSDLTFNVWGLLAAMSSTISFSLYNGLFPLNVIEDLLGNYAVISIVGTLVLLPVVIVKLVITKVLFTVRVKESLTSAMFHFVYNTTPISVLQGIGPLNYAFLNPFKIMTVILANIEYFKTPPFTWAVSVSLLVLFWGLFLHSIPSTFRHARFLFFYLLFIFVIMFVLITPFSSNSGSLMHKIQSVVSYGEFFSARNELIVGTPSSPDRLRISTSWVFEEPIPRNVILNIQALAKQNPNVILSVYCGTSQCAHSFQKLRIKNIEVEFLEISYLVKNMPIEGWLARHPINKVLADEEFENHLHDAVRLGLLWKYGGMYFDPTIAVIRQVNLGEYQENQSMHECWVSKPTMSSENDIPGILDIAFFPVKHPFHWKTCRSFC